jgi:hypothetical protein
MSYREKVAVCCEIHTKHINTLRGKNVKLLKVKPGGTYSDHLALQLKSQCTVMEHLISYVKMMVEMRGEMVSNGSIVLTYSMEQSPS